MRNSLFYVFNTTCSHIIALALFFQQHDNKAIKKFKSIDNSCIYSRNLIKTVRRSADNTCLKRKRVPKIILSALLNHLQMHLSLRIFCRDKRFQSDEMFARNWWRVTIRWCFRNIFLRQLSFECVTLLNRKKSQNQFFPRFRSSWKSSFDWIEPFKSSTNTHCIYREHLRWNQKK